MSGGSEEAKYPLANFKPRQYAGKIKTATRIRHVDRTLLDTLPIWPRVTASARSP